MDRHFRFATPRENAPVLAAFVDRFYAKFAAPDPRASSPMTSGCGCCPPISSSSRWNSNGKSVTLDGSPVGQPTAPVTWGGTGTDAQHAVFQLLHQGTVLVPVEFLAAIEPDDSLAADHHRQLLLNASRRARR